MENKSNQVFVTGATGLVGSHLIYSLVMAGRTVRASYRNAGKLDNVKRLFRNYGDSADNLFSRIEWIKTDLSDFQSLKKIIPGTGHLYHCAGTISFKGTDKEDIVKTNTRITANVVNAGIYSGVIKMCHVSSTSAIGARSGEINVTEDHPWFPEDRHSPYAVSKYLSEQEVWTGIGKGLNAVIVNPSIIIGPGDWNNGSLLFFPRIDRGMSFYTNGITGYVDVRDVIKSMTALMESHLSGERYIISSENLTFNQIFSLIARNLQVKRPRIPVPGFLSFPARFILRAAETITGRQGAVTPDNIISAFSRVGFDNSKIRKAIGISFMPVGRSIEDTCQIYRRENPRE